MAAEATRTCAIPNWPASTGTTSAPAAYARVVRVAAAPNARPRAASGTSRWKIVVLTTSATRLPAEATAIATNATASDGTSPSMARPAPKTSVPTTRSARKPEVTIRTPERTAPMTAPTPIPAFRYPVPSSPAPSCSTASSTVRMPSPPKANAPVTSASVRPASGRTMAANDGEDPAPSRVTDASSPSSPVSRPTGRGRMDGRPQSTAATTANEVALSRNAVSSPVVAIRRPATPGPMMNARLSSVDQALLAGPSSDSSRTIDGR